MSEQTAKQPMSLSMDPWGDLLAYWIDGFERSVLFADVLRQRGNQYHRHMAEKVPHVLSFGASLVMDGRKLARPVNYELVRIEPPVGIEIDLKKRPFVVIDPRAGHGPGIGGFKADSEIGVALQAGHPCYFVGFLPEPVPGQTVEDVMRAEAIFLEKVIELHPEADGRPTVVGNCQAGWQVMMAAATRPELFGPIIIAGAPLSYWGGGSPMRYTGGMLGGSWVTALMGDLGHGIFDGAWLVQNFEALNPANTFWTKSYNLYAKVDTEAPRYLGFEKWWGGHVLLNAEEMQYIADQLFIGNRLSSAELSTSDGVRIDLRKIRSPIIVFCSKGDEITPPAQALGWITDLYHGVQDIRAHGQTIVYCVHETIGHLGIFVSGSVAKKEHDEFASNIDLIDVLPPGLYEAVLVPRSEAGTDPAALIDGDHVLRFVARSMDDVRAVVAPDPEDERRFATAARISEINLGLYRSFVQPFVRAMATEPAAELMRRLHPQRLRYELFSDANPWLRLAEQMAGSIRADRHPVDDDNLFLQAERAVGRNIEAALQATGELRDRMVEASFQTLYGSLLLQALVGLGNPDRPVRPRPGEDPDHRIFVEGRIAELRTKLTEGGAREAWVRALIHIQMPLGAADERSFNLLRRMRDEWAVDMTVGRFKAMVRDQFLMLLMMPDEATAAIPRMLEGLPAEGRRHAAATLRQVVAAAGEMGAESERRLAAMEAVFNGQEADIRQAFDVELDAGSGKITRLPSRARRRVS